MFNVKACIWDLDYTLYSGGAEDSNHSIEQAMVRLLREEAIGADIMKDDEIVYTVRHEHLKNGSCYPYFMDRFGWTKEFLQLGTSRTADISSVPVCADLPDLFRASPIKHVINTHAHPIWVSRMLPHLKLAEFFPAEMVVCHIDHGHAEKHTSDVTHKAALALTGCAAADAVMIEDAEKNLRIPKEMGMKTVLVAPQRPETIAPYVDKWVARAADVFALI